MGTRGTSVLTRLLLPRGRGEPGGGGLLPVSYRGGEGREDGVRGLRAADGHQPEPPGGRAASGWAGAPGSPGCWSAVVPTDVMACDADPRVAILQVIIIAKLCQSCPGSGPPGREGREAGRGPGRAWGPSFSPPTVTANLWGCRLGFY